MKSKILIASLIIFNLATSAYAKTPFKPMGQTMVELLTDGWSIIGEAGNGIFLLAKEDKVSTCAIEFSGGHLKLLKGEKPSRDYSTIEMNCALHN